MSAHTQDEQASGGSWLQWLVTAAIALTVLTLAAAHAPKIIGLFLIGYGAVAGGILGWLARLAGLRARSVVVVCAMLIAGGTVGLTLRTHQLWAERTSALLEKKRPLPLPASLEGLPENVRGTFEAAWASRRPDLGFLAYLRDRVSPLGDWPSPWPGVFWGTEVVLGSAAGAWLARRFANAPALNDGRADR